MYSTSSGRGFLPLVTAAHEISPTCSCMRNPGEEECMIHIRESALLAAACAIQGKEEECMIHIRGIIITFPDPPGTKKNKKMRFLLLFLGDLLRDQFFSPLDPLDPLLHTYA